MNKARKYEKKQGRTPIDVSDRITGYDIESKDNSGKVVRYIEVKGRKSNVQVALTDNEYETALRLGNKYFVYVVTTKGIQIVRNPAQSCGIEQANQVVWTLKNWQEKAINVDFA